MKIMETYLPKLLPVMYGNEEHGDATRRVEEGDGK